MSVVGGADAAAPAANAKTVTSRTDSLTGVRTYVVKGKIGRGSVHAHNRSSRRLSTATINKAVVAGTATASLTFSSRCAPVTMKLVQSGITLATTSGSSGISATANVVTGTLAVKLSSNSCLTNYTLKVTNTPTPIPTPTPTTASPTPTPTTASPTPTTPVGTSVLTFGAIGDGVTDDTAALQAGLDATGAGATLLLPAGKVFKHSGVLKLRQAGQTVTGGGTLLASNEATSNVWISANNVTLSNVTLKMGTTTKRWETYDQMKLRLGPVTGVTLTDVTIDGSAAAGLYVGGASNFTFNRITVQNTRADAIHFTESSHDGTLTDATVRNPGDDGVAVVSYAAGGAAPVQNITITNPKLYGQSWGRGFSVVGGRNITWNNIYAEHSNAATIYVSAEGEYNTQAVSNVTFDGGTINYANDNAAVDHGAIMLYNSKAGAVNTDITIRNIAINNTRTGWAQVQINNANGGVQQRLTLNNLAFTNGPALFPYGVPTTGYNRTGWTYNGSPVANLTTWS